MEYRVAQLDEIPSPVDPDPSSFVWKPIRRQAAKRSTIV